MLPGLVQQFKSLVALQVSALFKLWLRRSFDARALHLLSPKWRRAVRLFRRAGATVFRLRDQANSLSKMVINVAAAAPASSKVGARRGRAPSAQRLALQSSARLRLGANLGEQAIQRLALCFC